MTPTPQNPGTRLHDLPLGQENDDQDSDEEDKDFNPSEFDSQTGAFDFTVDELEMIRQCIAHVHIPTWVGRPPKNLGEAAHGKLKAQKLLTLFTVIFPLIIPALWRNKNQSSMRLLENFHHFVALTNIIAFFSTSDIEADCDKDHIVQY